jgi:hypothetical protein
MGRTGAIAMPDPSDVVAAEVADLSDTEYVTPAEAARIRAMYEEPLSPERLAEIERHRLINKTVLQEPEE